MASGHCFAHSDYRGQETLVEICQSGHESVGDSIALRHEQRTGPRAKILRNDHVQQTRLPNSCSCR